MADTEETRATTQTQTNTLDVVCVDSYGNEYTFKLDNYKPNLTLQNVQDAFAIGINTGRWISRAGFPFTTVKRASTVQTMKYVTPLE